MVSHFITCMWMVIRPVSYFITGMWMVIPHGKSFHYVHVGGDSARELFHYVHVVGESPDESIHDVHVGSDSVWRVISLGASVLGLIYVSTEIFEEKVNDCW